MSNAESLAITRRQEYGFDVGSAIHNNYYTGKTVLELRCNGKIVVYKPKGGRK